MLHWLIIESHKLTIVCQIEDYLPKEGKYEERCLLNITSLLTESYTDNTIAMIIYFFTEIKAPIAVLGAEIDKLSPPELLRQFEEVLAARPEV